MSILIRDTEMPDNCINCAARHGAECWLADCSYIPNFRKERPKWCHLVPVPPHGRSIDADAFAAEMKKRQEEAGKWLREAKDRETAVRADAVLSFLCEVKLTLDAAPTIIEAEPCKEEGE